MSLMDMLKQAADGGDVDSSVSARKKPDNELDIPVGGDGSAKENIAPHEAVIQRLAENGGELPDDLKN